MSQIEKIAPSDKARWPYNLRIGVHVTDEMRRWLIEAFGHDDVYNDIETQTWLSSKTDEPDTHDIVYFLWGPGYIQFKHEQDMVAFVLRFSG